jgi:hypothetical protein
MLHERDIRSDSGCGERENLFVENDITRDINATCGAVEAFVAFVHGTISEKNAHLGPKL